MRAGRADARRVLSELAAAAPVAVYALGSGAGHLTRALNLVRRLRVRAVVLHLAGAVSPAAVPAGSRLVAVDPGAVREEAPRLLQQLAPTTRALLVDTFPGGLARELDDALLGRFRLRALLRRHLRPGSYEDDAALADRFDLTLLPYTPERCEWEGAVAGVHVGPLVRRLALADGTAWELAVVGDAARLPAGWRAALPCRTVFVAGPFRRLPRARRVLALGAGHNLIYELDALGVPFRALPQERAYDDQFRRADRLGVGVYERAQLLSFLEERA